MTPRVISPKKTLSTGANRPDMLVERTRRPAGAGGYGAGLATAGSDSLGSRCLARPGRSPERGETSARHHAVNNTQGLALGFFLVAWVALVAILAVSPDVREVTLGRLPGSGSWHWLGSR